MPTPTPGRMATASATPPLVDASLLASSKGTPASSAATQACAVASLQALPPEALLVLVILDHPHIRSRWSSLVLPLLESLSSKLASLHPGTRLMIGTVIYRPISAADKLSLVRPCSTLSKLPFVSGSKFLDTATKNRHWLDQIFSSSSTSASASWVPHPFSSRGAHAHWLDTLCIDLELERCTAEDGVKQAHNNRSHRDSAPVLEALVGALELLDTRAAPSASTLTGFAAVSPQRPPVMARHVLHISTCDSLAPLDLSAKPLLGQAKAYDHVTASQVCSELARKGISISSCGVRANDAKIAEVPPSPTKPALASSPSAASAVSQTAAANGVEQIHSLVSQAGSLSPDDLTQLIPSALRTRIQSDCILLVSGVAAAPVSASKKRGREDDEGSAAADGPAATKRSKSGSISKVESAQPAFQFPQGINAASLSAQAAALQQKIPKLHPSVSTKIIFLKQQQEIMFRNLSLVAAQMLKAENEGAPKNSTPGMNRPYLEQLRNQLIAQQQGLRMLIQKVITGAEQNPNFNICLQSLVSIDKEAREMGVPLGGPSGAQPGIGRPALSGPAAGGAPPAGSQAPSLPGGPSGGAAGAPTNGRPGGMVSDGQVGPGGQTAGASNTAMAATGQAGGRPRPFWKGPITWSIISDPTTKAKREISTYVAATSNANAFDKLMLPWPDKLQITAISQLAPRNLQIYAQSQGAPYVLFTAEPPGAPPAGSEGTALTPERNATMYASLAGSLDAKKSCAFIRHGSSPGSGMVLFATTQPTSSAERNVAPGSVPPKLIGVYFKDPVPFARLLAAQAAQQQQAAAQGGGQPATANLSPTKNGQALPANAAAAAAAATGTTLNSVAEGSSGWSSAAQRAPSIPNVAGNSLGLGGLGASTTGVAPSSAVGASEAAPGIVGGGGAVGGEAGTGGAGASVGTVQADATQTQLNQPQQQSIQQQQQLQQLLQTATSTSGTAGGGGGPLPTDLASLAQLLGLAAPGAAAAGNTTQSEPQGAGASTATGDSGNAAQPPPQHSLPPVTIEQLRALGLLQ
ncbi:hypothetical protein ACQY0O_008096 [Thecaphora frezii]